MLKELVRKGFKRRPPNKWPTYNGGFLDRTKFVTASQAGDCERQIWYDKQYPQAQLDRWGYAERGHSSEAWHVDTLKHSGAKFICVGDQQVSVYKDYLSATPDGFMVQDNGEHLYVEFKGFDPRTNTSRFPKPPHILQVQIGMSLAAHCFQWVIKKAHILYTNAADYEDMHEFAIEFDPLIEEQHQVRAEYILNSESPEELEPEGVFNGTCKRCRHAARCSGAIDAARRERETNKENFDAAKRLFRS